MTRSCRRRAERRGASRVAAWCLTGVAGAATFGAALLGASGAGAASGKPAAMLVASIAAGEAQSSVHWTSLTSIAGGGELDLVTDAATNSGTQTVTFTVSGSTGHAEELLVGGNAYIKGDQIGLSVIAGFTPTASIKEADRWIEVAPSSSAFASVVAGLTVHSTMSELAMSGKVTLLPPGTLNGQAVQGLIGTTMATKGSPSSHETVYIRSSGAPLPMESRTSSTDGFATATFSSWGEHVSLTAPKGAVPLAPAWIQKS